MILNATFRKKIDGSPEVHVQTEVVVGEGHDISEAELVEGNKCERVG